MIQPPGRATWHVAHLGVRPDLRSRGFGAALLEHLLATGLSQGFRVAALDVAVTNPRAQSLYERTGFAVTAERKSRLAHAGATVADHHRMARGP